MFVFEVFLEGRLRYQVGGSAVVEGDACYSFFLG